MKNNLKKNAAWITVLAVLGSNRRPLVPKSKIKQPTDRTTGGSREWKAYSL
jgi:hypothetical protein